MKTARWARRRQRSILFLLAVLCAGGVAAAFSLPVGLFPRVSFPRVVVDLDAGDRPAERMAVEVTWPVEEAVRSVAGVLNVRSTSSRGSSEISINFEWGLDMSGAMLQVQSAVNQTLGSLPAGTTFTVRRMDPTVFPVLAYSLTSDTRSQVELNDLALYQIRPVLSTVRGVASIGVVGGNTAEYEVTADPAKLESFGLTLDDVSRALSLSNVITAVGRLEDRDKLYLILSDTQFHNPEEIGRTVLSSGTDGLVLLEDVATVSSGVEPGWTTVVADGREAVLLGVYQQPGGNTIQIGRDIRAKFAELQKIIPPDVRIAQWYDQSELILSSAGSVRDAVAIGVLLAGLVLLLFLRSWKVALIAVLTVPAVLAATTLLLKLLGMSFNIMTLGGMAAAVALIIDDVIVMIEHISRRLREGGGEAEDRVTAAADEFSRPLAGSSASTIIIFLPLAFLSGVTGAFFKALSLTMAASLAISFLAAWLAAPILARRLLGPGDMPEEGDGAAASRVKEAYGRIMGRLLPRPWIVILVLLPLLVLGWLAYRGVGSGFMPAIDEGGFVLDYRAPAGASLTETDRLLDLVGKILRETPEVETYSRRTGLQLGGGVTEANEGDYFVRLKPPPRRDIWAVMDDVRARVEHSVPGLEIEMALLMEDLIGDLTAVPQPIEVKLFSDDEKTLLDLAPRVAAAIGKIPGVVDVNDGVVMAGDALDIRVDRERAALEGVAPGDVTAALSAYLTGVVATQIQEGPKMVGVRAWVPQEKRNTAADIGRLLLKAPDGHVFPVKRVAAVAAVTGQPQITRDDLKRMTAVTGRISGRDLGSTIRDVKAVLGTGGLIPQGVYYTLGGLYRQQQIAFQGLMVVFASAVVLVFFLLLYLYESFRAAAAILLTTLLAVSAVFAGLFLTGTELNITAMMGLTMIVGIVTEVGIFYYSELVELPPETDLRERLILAGRNRLRPIAMTTLAAILALAPLALGIGQGSAMQQPLAIAIISGLTVQLPLVLIVLPSLLILLGRKR